MIFDHEINALKPPYTIRVGGVGRLAPELRRTLLQLRDDLALIGDGNVTAVRLPEFEIL